MNAQDRLASLRVNPHWAKLPLFDRSKWQRVRFGDVVENLNETCDPAEVGIERYIGLEHLEPGSLHIRSWGSVSDGTTFTRRVRPGQVLFGKRRAYQRKVAVASFDAVVSGDIYVLTAKNNRLLGELLPFLCMSDRFYNHAVGTSSGSLSPRTNWNSLASFQFDISPLEKQRNAADLLIEVDNAILQYREIMADVSRMRRAEVAQALTNAPASLVHVGDIAKFTSGVSIPVSDLPKKANELAAVPVYGGNGISGYTDKWMMEAPSVVIGRVGQFCGCVSLTSGRCWITDNALFAKEISPKIDVAFLALALDSAQLNRNKIGNYLPLINQRVVHTTELRLPGRRRQSELVAKVRDLDSEAESANAHIRTCLYPLRLKLINALS